MRSARCRAFYRQRGFAAYGPTFMEDGILHVAMRLALAAGPLEARAMSELIGAALVLLASHFGISSTPLRAWLVARFGERGYLVLYSLIAFAAIGWLIGAWARAPYVELWPPAPWLAWVPFLVVPLALVLLVSGLSTPNPTAVGAPDLLARASRCRACSASPATPSCGAWACGPAPTSSPTAISRASSCSRASARWRCSARC